MPARFAFWKGASVGLIWVLLLLSSTLSAQRQQQDDILFDGRDPGSILDDTLDRVYVKQEFDKNYWPALKSLAVPGWGQIHNRQFEKAPVIWAATGLVLANGLRHRRNMFEFQDEVARLESVPVVSVLEPPKITPLDFRFKELNAKLNYRWSLAAVGFIHLLNVTDAYASAFILDSGKPHSPTKAALMSAVLPGWGQIYNRRVWKTPIVIGGLAAAGYAIWWNVDQHKIFRDELIARRYGPYSIENPFNTTYDDGRGLGGITDERLFQSRDFYLDQLDTAILIGFLVYAVNIIDAAVDAHLRDFDIDDDLGVETSLTPAIFPNGAIGLNWQLNF